MKNNILFLLTMAVLSFGIVSCKSGGFKPDDKAMADITQFADEMKGMKVEYESLAGDIQTAIDTMNACNKTCMMDKKAKKNQEKMADSLKNDCNSILKKMEDIKGAHSGLKAELDKLDADFGTWRTKAEKGELQKETFEKEMEAYKSKKAGYQAKINEWTDQISSLQGQCEKNCETMEGCCE